MEVTAYIYRVPQLLLGGGALLRTPELQVVNFPSYISAKHNQGNKKNGMSGIDRAP